MLNFEPYSLLSFSSGFVLVQSPFYSSWNGLACIFYLLASRGNLNVHRVVELEVICSTALIGVDFMAYAKLKYRYWIRFSYVTPS